MMDDAKRGNIDLIITKSISKFGRDTEETIISIRTLSALGVYVFFEVDNLNSRSPDSEMLITMQSGIARSENINLRENVKWGIRRRLGNGSSPIYDRPCYGYRADETAGLIIVPEEAAIVRRIFAMYLCGMSILKIKATLEAEGITSPAGKSNWSKRSIDMILSNKKYCGSSIVKGDDKLYECVNHHEQVISPEVFHQVQTARAERTNIETGEDGRKHRRSTKYTSQSAQER